MSAILFWLLYGIWWVSYALCYSLPLIILDAPSWVLWIVSIITVGFKAFVFNSPRVFFTDIILIVPWVLSFPIMISEPFSAFSVVYYILFGVSLVAYIIPSVLQVVSFIRVLVSNAFKKR